MWNELLLALNFLLPVTVDGERTVSNNTNSVYLIEEQVIETPEQAIEAFQKSHQKPSPKKGLSFGFSNKTYWFLTRVQNKSGDSQLIASFDFQGLDTIDIWILHQEKDQWLRHTTQGDYVPLSQRPYKIRIPNFSFDIPSGTEALILYRIKTSSPLQAGFNLATPYVFSLRYNMDNALLLFCYGVLSLMALFHLIQWFMQRNPLDLVYASMSICIGCSNAAMQGHLFQHLIPNDYPRSANLFNVFYTIPGLFLMCEFAIRFLSLHRFWPAGRRILRVAQCLTLLPLVGYIAAGFALYNKILQMLALLYPVLLLSAAVTAWFKGQTAARFFIIAFTTYLVGLITFLLKNLGVIGYSPIIQFSTAIGSAVYVIFLALALGDRVRLLKRAAQEAEAKRAAEEAAHKAEIKAWNDSLEDKISEQTRDIRSLLANTKIGLMSITKELGVHKDYARFLETILEEQDLADRPFIEVLMEKMDLGPDEKEKILTAMEYAIGEDEMLFEANASVFPREAKIQVGDKTKYLDFDWSPVVGKDGAVERVLVSLRDMTENLKLRDEAEQGRRNLQYLGEVLEVGPVRFDKFDRTADQTWDAIAHILTNSAQKGSMSFDDIRKVYVGLHTMKGVTRMYKFSALTDVIHLAEDVVADKKELTTDDITLLHNRLADIRSAHTMYKKVIQPLYRIQEQLEQMEADLQPNDLRILLLEMSELADRLAKELGKGGCLLDVDIPHGIIVPESYAKALENSLIHLVRNSVDHGLESQEERTSKGKQALGRIRAYVNSTGQLCIEDDGRGLNLSRIQSKAEKLGKRPKDEGELANLIFDSGFSTKESANDISGRGIGMDAVREFMRSVGSNIQIIPKGREGDYLTFHFAIDLPQEQRKIA